jgi:hypothetical protein
MSDVSRIENRAAAENYAYRSKQFRKGQEVRIVAAGNHWFNRSGKITEIDGDTIWIGFQGGEGAVPFGREEIRTQ